MQDEYFYSADDEQVGPVTRNELLELKQSGVVSDSSLVWCEGRDEWEHFEKVFPNTTTEGNRELKICAHSGRRMEPDKMLRYGDHWIDPAVKDDFVQSLQENPDLLTKFEVFQFEADLQLWNIFRQSFLIIRSQWLALLVVTAAIWGPLYLILDYFAYTTGGEAGIALANSYDRIDQALDFWLGTIVTSAAYHLSWKRWAGEPFTSVSTTFGDGFANYWRLLGTKFVAGILIILCVFLALLPVIFVDNLAFRILWGVVAGSGALYVIGRSALSEPLAIINQEGGSAAVKASWDATSGRFWRCCGYLIAVFIFPMILVFGFSLLTEIPFLQNFIVSAVSSVLASLSITVAAVGLTVVAIHFQENPKLKKEEEPTPPDPLHTPQ